MKFDTPQQLFDHVVFTLRKQGGPSAIVSLITGDVKCRYRSPEGRVCAAGACIPDEIYDSEWEGKNIASLLDTFPKLGYLGRFRSLILALQKAHDGPVIAGSTDDAKWLSEFEKRAERVAIMYELAYHAV